MSTIHNSQDMETIQMSIDRWLDWEDVVYIHNGILLSHEKEPNDAICCNMDGTRDSHAKWSKSERERQIPYDITYLKSNTRGKWTHLQKRNKLMDMENRLVVALGEGWGSGMDWEFAVSRCKLLHLEQVSIPHLPNPIICRWTFGLFPCPGYCE